MLKTQLAVSTTERRLLPCCVRGERDVSAVDRLPLALVQLFDGVYSTGNEWRWDSPRLTLNEKDIEALF